MRNQRAAFISILAISGGVAGQATAQAPPSPALGSAIRLVQAVVAVCAQDGQKVAAAVVDAQGQLKAFAAADGASKLAGTASLRKAAASAVFADTTANLNRRKAADPALRLKLEGDPAFLTWSGGIPLKRGGEVIGGLGVGGATNSGGDEACATAALAKEPSGSN